MFELAWGKKSVNCQHYALFVTFLQNSKMAYIIPLQYLTLDKQHVLL
jgi:hypothetical protein